MDTFFEDFVFKYVNPQAPLGIAALFIILVWSFFWKALALWKAARNNERVWFIPILVLNTIGILEIAYLFFFAGQKLTIDKMKENFRSYKFTLPKFLQKSK